MASESRRSRPTVTGRFELANRLYVFEIPEEATFPGTQQDTFESGNFARWTPTAGEFAVASTSASRVLRQSSLAGDAGANLTAIDWNDQSIEADIRPLEFAGNGRWFGLVTRRVDAQNYYYVTFRSPDLISLRRLRNGVVTELGWRGRRLTSRPAAATACGWNRSVTSTRCSSKAFRACTPRTRRSRTEAPASPATARASTWTTSS